jgi:hypothetical protein
MAAECTDVTKPEKYT